jgi:hypothetical protein
VDTSQGQPGRHDENQQRKDDGDGDHEWEVLFREFAGHGNAALLRARA